MGRIKTYLQNFNKSITSFEKIYLRTMGMRCTEEYEIIRKGTEAEVSEYGIRYNGSGKERFLEKQVICSADEIIELLDKCRVLLWDGFHGAHPKGVLDGTMFTFEAVVNDNIKVQAEGSQNFPEHYRDFVNELYEILRGER